MTSRHTGSVSSATNQWVGFGGETTTNYSITSNDSRWDTDGDNTRYFHKQLNRGLLLPRNLYSSKRVTSFSSNGSCTITKTGITPPRGWNSSGVHSVNNFNKVIIDWDEAIGYVDTDSINRAAIGAVESLTRSGFDALTFAGELRETLSMVVGAGSRLANGLLSVKKAKTWEDAWLEWRYGWRPLLSDMRAIQSAMSEKKSFAVYKARSGFSSSKSISSTYSVDSGSALHTYSRLLKLDFSYRGNAYSLTRPDTIHTDVLPTAWELLRFSFVIDWFINIGSTLSALSGSLRTPDLQTAAGYELLVDLSVTQTGFANHTGYSISNATYASHTTGYLRTRQPWSVSYKPTVRLNFDATKLLDLLLIFKRPFRGRYS
jgi:hypothetical protein